MGGARDECTYEDLEAFYRAAPLRRRRGEEAERRTTGCIGPKAALDGLVGE